MKPKSYILSLLTVGALFACSDDNIVEPNQPLIEPDATLSLSIQTNTATKAGQTATDQQDVIQDLTVAVFDNGAYGTTTGDNPLKAIKTVYLAAGMEKLDEIEEIEVRSGSLKVLVLANVMDKLSAAQKAYFEVDAEGLPKTATPMQRFLDLQTELSQEANGYLTMSSAVIPIIARTNYLNCLGYSDTEVGQKTIPAGGIGSCNLTAYSAEMTDKGVKLYRTVSRVQLTKLTVVPASEWGTMTSFKLDSVFVANIKSHSQVAATAGWGNVESSSGYNWYDGAGAIGSGSLKQHTNGTLQSWLGQDETWTWTTGQTETYLPPYFFYVYENGQVTDANRNGDYTLLVIKATTSYTNRPTETGYYHVVVNKDNVSSITGVDNHTYVKRNVKYNIEATIKGPGSKDEFTPEVAACIAAKVKVLEWNVVDVTPSVE